MPRPTYEDRYPSYNGMGYRVTNEDPMAFGQMLDARGLTQMGTVGGIVSGGEIPLLTLLPRAKRVIGVDHTYYSIGAALCKMIMLDMLGAEKFKTLTAGIYTKEVKDAVKEACAHIPPDVVAAASLSSIDGYTFNDFNRHYKNVTIAQLGAIRERLDCIHLVHGDLKDITADGPFDLVYISNAWEHGSRETSQYSASSAVRVEQTARAMLEREGVLLSAFYSTPKAGDGEFSRWKTIASRKNCGTSNWIQHLMVRDDDRLPEWAPMALATA